MSWEKGPVAALMTRMMTTLWSSPLQRLGKGSRGDEAGGRPGTSPEPPISIWTLDWGPEYMNCSEWSDIFFLVQGVVSDWPTWYQFRGGQTYVWWENLRAHPLQEMVIYDHHQFLRHVGFSRIWAHMEVRYHWGNNLGAKKIF